MNGPEFHEYLTPAEVADLLRVTMKTVYRMAKRGTFPSFKVGRALRFDRHDLEKYIEKHKSRGRGDAGAGGDR